ncbi:sigma-70 family RNA polymerase sigma factor [Sphingomonas sp. HT-1]|uniref:sigma-70 family RNA polymerase sigma factor n=1 Tax=unclassified Sphingomonas TaxID=196159 RepID=UPI000306F1F4|nr:MULTISPECIES: sigma-70 family RNA polymerase sigma factor [unclassified Sphingomonas]KTF69707.1 RNA polymerase subunit sigma [Sphingomonas sp. WG]
MASPTPSAGEGARALLVQALADVAQGDRAALKTVYDLTAAKLMGVCLRICQDREAAEDVMQEVFLKIWNRAGRFDAARASPITWLCVIARNSAVDWRRTRGLGEAAPIDAAMDVPDGADSAEARLQAVEMQARIFSCIEALEEKQRGAIRAAFFNGRTYPELAQAAAVPLGTMKSWIRRGLLQLRGCLGDG